MGHSPSHLFGIVLRGRDRVPGRKAVVAATVPRALFGASRRDGHVPGYTGLGGRRRDVASNAEPARIALREAVAAAINRIREAERRSAIQAQLTPVSREQQAQRESAENPRAEDISVGQPKG
jgi:hypothetical protein